MEVRDRYQREAGGSMQHIATLAVRFVALAATTRAAIDAATKLDDADTADLCTEASRGSTRDVGSWKPTCGRET